MGTGPSTPLLQEFPLRRCRQKAPRRLSVRNYPRVLSIRRDQLPTKKRLSAFLLLTKSPPNVSKMLIELLSLLSSFGSRGRVP